MPKLELKQIQKELESGQIWPVYWLYGQERMKSRELLKRIRRAVLSEEAASGGLSFCEEHLDGAEADGERVLEAAQSLSLGGGTRLIIVRDAHSIKDPEPLVDLFGPKGPRESLPSVCVFLSKDLDGRKKLSKQLLESAAVVPCEEVPDEEREAWVGYLSKRQGLELESRLVAQLRSLDPWSLDIVDQELEKLSLARESGLSELEAEQVLQGGISSDQGPDAFFDAFFGKDVARSVEIAGRFADQPDESLPLLGLLAWNVRHLTQVLADRERSTRTVKLSPFLADRFTRWSRRWTLSEALRLQSALSEIDFDLKQTARLPLGSWTRMVLEFTS